MEVPRGFTRCDECEGKRWVTGKPPIGRPCPSCSGSGLVPTEKLREEVAGDLWFLDLADGPKERYYRQADAVLAKVAEHLGGRE